MDNSQPGNYVSLNHAFDRSNEMKEFERKIMSRSLAPPIEVKPYDQKQPLSDMSPKQSSLPVKSSPTSDFMTKYPFQGKSTVQFPLTRRQHYNPTELGTDLIEGCCMGDSWSHNRHGTCFFLLLAFIIILVWYHNSDQPVNPVSPLKTIPSISRQINSLFD